jgi:2-alkenal reductase
MDGHIVTNYHVVEGAEKIDVTFRDGTMARAEVVGADSESDIAVIQVKDVDPSVLHPVTFANSSELYVGQPVLAIGSPFGQEWTLTTGIVSALGRTISSGFSDFSIPSAIQTDAAINPGNSGGPLLDVDGNVIGVNSQILSRSGSNAGVGFAIPANLVQRVARALIEDGAYHYAWLGISGGALTIDLIEAMDLAPNQRGVMVGEVTAGGPADKAGVHGADSTVEIDGQEVRVGGDVITAVDSVPVSHMDELIAYLVEQTNPGDEVTLTILRDGSEQQIAVTLGERQQAQSQPDPETTK